ncbi:MAG: hypothetical protein HW421_1232 [Ignavibacteria bacterium]|nr:hypothetical protein [Ignavibacteria bacterium]
MEVVEILRISVFHQVYFINFIRYAEVVMKTNVTFRHFKSQHPDLHEAAIESSSGFSKYYDDIISSNVEFINDSEKTVEFTVHVQGSTLASKHSSDDFHKSLNGATDKMVRQLNKLKTKHSKVLTS